LVHEQEVDWSTGARVRQRPTAGATGHDAVDHGDGFLVQGHHPFAGQLAQRHFQPAAVPVDLVHAVQFQVAQFADAYSGGAGQKQRVGV
jgi:hypothetical protein